MICGYKTESGFEYCTYKVVKTKTKDSYFCTYKVYKSIGDAKAACK